MQIKSSNCIDLEITIGVFEGSLASAWRNCSEQYGEDEFEFLIRYLSETVIQKVSWGKYAKEYVPLESLNSSNSSDNENDPEPLVEIQIRKDLWTKMILRHLY